MINALALGPPHTHDSVLGLLSEIHDSTPLDDPIRLERHGTVQDRRKFLLLSDLYTNQYVKKSLLMMYGSGWMHLPARLAYTLLEGLGDITQIKYAAKSQQYYPMRQDARIAPPVSSDKRRLVIRNHNV